LGFYGRDESRSRQWLTARELDAYSARLHLKNVLEHDGVEALRSEILAFARREGTPTTEGLRLAEIYRRKGIPALVDELSRF
jgi:hypothetical protein